MTELKLGKTEKITSNIEIAAKFLLTHLLDMILEFKQTNIEKTIVDWREHASQQISMRRDTKKCCFPVIETSPDYIRFAVSDLLDVVIDEKTIADRLKEESIRYGCIVSIDINFSEPYRLYRFANISFKRVDSCV